MVPRPLRRNLADWYRQSAVIEPGQPIPQRRTPLPRMNYTEREDRSPRLVTPCDRVRRTGENAASGGATPLPVRRPNAPAMPPSRQNRPVKNSSSVLLPAAITDPPPIPAPLPHSRTPSRRQIAIDRPPRRNRGFLPCRLSDDSPQCGQIGCDWAGIRNPSHEERFPRPRLSGCCRFS